MTLIRILRLMFRSNLLIMRSLVLGVMFLTSVLLLSCRQAANKNIKTHEEVLEQTFKKLPDVEVIEGKFDSVSFIANFGNQYATPQWQTVFYIDEWFECVYACDLEIKNGIVVLKGKPKLHINEITSVKGRSRDYGQQRILRGSELTKFIESGFDLSTVELTSKGRKHPPENFMDYWHEIYP